VSWIRLRKGRVFPHLWHARLVTLDHSDT